MVENNINMTKPLTVYKASAGSGKTFTLATEYIKLLVQNPLSYSNILAVTFTNKATEEMKKRILSQLYGIWKRLDDSTSYTNKVCHDLDASEAFVSRQAGIALHQLLHHYSYFRVETIDAFFQSVLRNLARELDLTANLRIELNDAQVEEMAVDKMIEALDTKSPVLQWIMKYIYANISEDKSWNVIGQIKNFGQTIFRDYYKEASQQIDKKMGEEGFFEAFAERLKKERKESVAKMTEVAETFFDALDGEGLSPSDLSYGNTGVAGFFVKLRRGEFDESIIGKRVADCLDAADKWVKKTSPDRLRIMALADEQLIPLLRYAVDERPKQWRRFKSADITLRHLDQLRLLSTIEKKVHELNEEANRFLLSDTQNMLHSLIRDTDSPFIFEKIGTRLEHIMIDEFQDTSTIQWKNFKVLLMECMSHTDTSNLIVGDVKQSIYRWRAGDWRLLNDIKSQFPYPDTQLQINTLGTNFRSRRNIIDFNNAFFTVAAQVERDALAEDSESLADQLTTAYEDVAQCVPDGKPSDGRVEVSLLPNDDYEQKTLELITATIQRLIDSGIRQNDIAILVRTNKHIPLIANYIMDNMEGVNVVSNEAFRLDASVAVNTIVLALRLLAHPDDEITRATLLKIYQKEVLANGKTDTQLFLANDDETAVLPPSFTENMESLAGQPLYDLAEQLYSIFSLSRLKGQSAYLCAFYDQLSSFTEDNFSNINAFLNEWDSRLCSKTVSSEDMEGVRLLSIHKSKGLEFNNVIVPFCDWQLEKPNVIWCKTDVEPYCELPLVPVDFSRKELMGTVYEDSYIEEHFQNIVDNLNLLYVAFTRAGHNLFVVGKRGAAASRSGLIEKVLPLLPNQLNGGAITNDGIDDSSPMAFDYGELYVPMKVVKRESRNVFLQQSQPLELEIETFKTKTEFRQSNKSRDFIEGTDETDRQSTYIKVGSLLHQVFSTIRTSDDIDNALQQLEQDGVLYEEGLTSEQVTTMLRRRLADKRVADWFSNRWQIFNECTILSRDPTTGAVRERRPDRVMYDGKEMIVVDFKFGRERDEYLDQVKEYIDFLRAMGYPNVKGYLWFVYNNKIVKVSDLE